LTPADPEKVPPLLLPGDPIHDPNVQPAQLTLPGGAPGDVSPPARQPVADPPAPVVRIQVRVPADSPPGDDIKYLITVQNVSPADAHAVTVRNPLPAGVEGAVKAEPPWDPKLSKDPQKQLVWSFGTLKAGQSHKIELTLKPKQGVTEVKNLAYVQFEHGEQVTTRISGPALKVAKTAPKQTVRDDPFVVRVLVENTGKVPAENVRVVENVDRTAEVEAVTTGASRAKSGENQWEWQIGTLMPGQRKVIEYRVTPRQAADALTTTNVSAGKSVQEQARTTTRVLVPGLTVKLTGPTKVDPGEAAEYEIVVRNTGTLPSTNVRVSGAVPADCKVTRKTEGGQVYRDQVVWTVPRLEAGEAHSFRLWLKASTTGLRTVAASATDARKTRSAHEQRTLFQGAAALLWETVPDPVELAVGRQGTFTVRVKNNGGEAARNVRVEVELPDAVTLVQTTPQVRPDGKKVVFGAEAVEPYGEKVYTITYRAERGAQAWFRVKMTADALGDRPMTTEKAVEITGGAR
jgi:uncharacterized repeat protein (TIGR01451 family)